VCLDKNDNDPQHVAITVASSIGVGLADDDTRTSPSRFRIYINGDPNPKLDVDGPPAVHGFHTSDAHAQIDTTVAFVPKDVWYSDHVLRVGSDGYGGPDDEDDAGQDKNKGYYSWRGVVYLLAMHDRPLSAANVVENGKKANLPNTAPSAAAMVARVAEDSCTQLGTAPLGPFAAPNVYDFDVDVLGQSQDIDVSVTGLADTALKPAQGALYSDAGCSPANVLPNPLPSPPPPFASLWYGPAADTSSDQADASSSVTSKRSPYDTLKWTLSDGIIATPIDAEIQIEVDPVNDAPVALDGSVEVRRPSPQRPWPPQRPCPACARRAEARRPPPSPPHRSGVHDHT